MWNLDESRVATVLVTLFGVAVTGFCAWLLVVWAPSLNVDADERALDDQVTGLSETTPSDPGDQDGRAARAGVVVLGDTFTTGATGETTVEDTWPEQLCEVSRCEYDPSFAEAGSGFVARGVEGTRFGERVDAVIAAQPDVVIVAGGASDKGAPPDVLQSRIADVLDRLRAGLPESRIVVFSPFWRNAQVPPEIRATRDLLRERASSAGLDFVDVSEVFDAAGRDLVTDDGVPTSAGHAKVAAAVSDTVQENLEQVQGYPGG